MTTASPVHCHYCIDVLVSKLYNREPFDFSELQKLYNKHQLFIKECNPQKNGTASTTTTTVNGSSFPNDTMTSLKIGNSALNGTYASATSFPQPKSPLFVTWKARSKSGRMDLRGCIGTFEPKQLDAGLREYALTAGLHDSRFDPIGLKELSRLECGVTLLHDFEPAADPMDWELGKHGLQIDFVYHHRRMGATYLPDVPVEQGWSKEETLTSLMRKAGWTGRSSEWTKVPLRVTRYQGSKATTLWDEYKELVDGDWLYSAVDDGDDEGLDRQEVLHNGYA